MGTHSKSSGQNDVPGYRLRPFPPDPALLEGVKRALTSDQAHHVRKFEDNVVYGKMRIGGRGYFFKIIPPGGFDDEMRYPHFLHAMGLERFAVPVRVFPKQRLLVAPTIQGFNFDRGGPALLHQFLKYPDLLKLTIVDALLARSTDRHTGNLMWDTQHHRLYVIDNESSFPLLRGAQKSVAMRVDRALPRALRRSGLATPLPKPVLRDLLRRGERYSRTLPPELQPGFSFRLNLLRNLANSPSPTVADLLALGKVPHPKF